jgi:hypothetical protein
MKNERGREGLGFVLLVYVASRLFYLVVGPLSASVVPVGSFQRVTSDVPFGTLNLWAHWDGEHYVALAAGGYLQPPYDVSTAFFPLYPLLMRSFAELFGGPLSLGALSLWGVLISVAALPFALYFIYRIVEEDFAEQTARNTILILCFFPTTFFFNAAYTESLFLALSAASLWAVRVRKDLLLGCALAGFATATRNVGIFLVVPLVYEWVRGGLWRSYGWWGGLGSLALAPSGLVWYAAYLWMRSGDPFLFYSAQGYWSREATDPWTFVTSIFVEAYEGLRDLLGPRPPANSLLGDLMGRLNDATDVYNLLFLLLAMTLLLLGLRVLPFSLSAYAFLLVFPPILFGTPQGPLMGLPRYVLVAFPIFIVLGKLLEDRRLLGGWLVLSGAASLVLCALFVSWRFVA